MRTYMLFCVNQRSSSLNICCSKNCFRENIMKKWNTLLVSNTVCP